MLLPRIWLTFKLKLVSVSWLVLDPSMSGELESPIYSLWGHFPKVLEESISLKFAFILLPTLYVYCVSSGGIVWVPVCH